MKASELRLGNWYNEFGIPKQVTPELIKKLDYIQRNNKIAVDVSSIPLTEEWLIKFGFERFINKKQYDYLLNGVQLCFDSDENCYWLYQFENAPLQYVHQLQNLYFALTRKELEITKNKQNEKN